MNKPKFKEGDSVVINTNILSEEDYAFLDLNTTLKQREKLFKSCHIKKAIERYGLIFYEIKEIEDAYDNLYFREDIFILANNEPNKLINWIERK